MAVDPAAVSSRQNKTLRTHDGRGTFNIKTKLPLSKTIVLLVYSGLDAWRLSLGSDQTVSCAGSTIKTRPSTLRTETGGSDGERCVAAQGGLPEFAADLDLAGGVERGAGDGGAADHGLRAGEDLAAAGAEGDPGEAEGDDAEAEACADGGCGVDAQLGDGAVDQRGEAEDEGDDAGEGEDSVAGELCFEHASGRRRRAAGRSRCAGWAEG